MTKRFRIIHRLFFTVLLWGTTTASAQKSGRAAASPMQQPMGAAFFPAHPLLLPAPGHIEYGDGHFPLAAVAIYIPANAGKDIVFALNELRAMILEKTGKSVRTVPGAAQATVNYTVQQPGPQLAGTEALKGPGERENYSLQVSHTGIHIQAISPAGLFYAVQTLRQLVEGSGVGTAFPEVRITDQPALACRGVMMDFAHGSLLAVAEIKRQIDFLARFKTNQYYFYNEVSLELKGYPTLNYGSSYSQAEIREIIQYAAQRHMDLIPFVAFYGHLHEFIRNEQYADLAIGRYGHEMDPRNPRVDSILKDWIKQYAALFKSPFIHVGFDETWETNRIATDIDHDIHSEELWLRHLQFVQQELKGYGKTVLAWTDMSSFYPDIMTRFPKDVIPVIWEYAPDTVALHHYLDPVLKEKHPFFIQPAVSGWGHLYPAADYTFENIDQCLRSGIANHTLGFITSVWTDAVEPFTRPSWMFMAYGCIGAWQGAPPDRSSFTGAYASLVYPEVAVDVKRALQLLGLSQESLAKCLGKNTGNMPGGTLIESWLNPFTPYYRRITNEHIGDFKAARLQSEQAAGFLINALGHCAAKDSTFIQSMIVTARLMNYSATRFIWTQTICDRWNESMLGKKKNDFVYYDISYTCHGLLVDLMNEMGELKDAYARCWLSESMPYRMNTMLGRFDTEFGFWQKLALKIQAYRIQHPGDEVATQTFEDTFKPDF